MILNKVRIIEKLWGRVKNKKGHFDALKQYDLKDFKTALSAMPTSILGRAAKNKWLWREDPMDVTWKCLQIALNDLECVVREAFFESLSLEWCHRLVKTLFDEKDIDILHDLEYEDMEKAVAAFRSKFKLKEIVPEYYENELD